MLDFNSCVPVQWKISLLKGYKIRIVKLCSERFVGDAIDELKKIFAANCYPKELMIIF